VRLHCPGQGALAGDFVSGSFEADEAMAAVLGQVQGAGPRIDDAEPVAPADQVHDVDEAPYQVRERAGELDPGRFDDGAPVPDSGHRAPVGETERPGRDLPGQPGPDEPGDVLAFLHGGLGHAGQAVQ